VYGCCLLFSGCSASDRSATTPAAPNANSSPSASASVPAALPITAPGLPAELADLRFGVSTADARRRWPKLFDRKGLKIADGPVRVSASVSRERDLLAGVSVEFPSPATLESAVAGWGEPAYVFGNGRSSARARG